MGKPTQNREWLLKMAAAEDEVGSVNIGTAEDVMAELVADSFTAPSLSLLVKLGSIAVHADEFTGPTGHEFDLVALKQGLADPEVIEWLDAMRKLAFLPVKRPQC